MATSEPPDECLRDALPPARPAEAHALRVAAELPGSCIVCTTLGRAQAAVALAAARPAARVVAWMLDQFHAERVREIAAIPPGLVVACTADLPAAPEAEPYDLAVLPLSKSGETELSRDLLQQLLHGLAIGGRLVAAVDHPDDRWLHEQLASYGETVRVRPSDEASPDSICYVVRKTREVKKLRDFSCEVVFRDCGRLLTAFTRPGVFAHRRIDPAARHLLDAVELAPGARVVEIGCGSGCVSLGLAARDPSVHVHALDAAARAVECTRRGAAHNGLPNVEVALEAGGAVPEPGTYDLALANPPYYADFRIAELFVEAARRALAPGGALLVITKQPTWYLEHLPQTWTHVAQATVKGYRLIEAVRPER